jgi:hypothetical protein
MLRCESLDHIKKTAALFSPLGGFDLDPATVANIAQISSLKFGYDIKISHHVFDRHLIFHEICRFPEAQKISSNELIYKHAPKITAPVLGQLQG